MAESAQSAEWWRDRLLNKFRAEIPWRRHFQDVYEARTGAIPVIERYREAYRRLIDMSRTPWGRLVIDIVTERLVIQGFRVGDDEVDTDLWSLFRMNEINTMQHQVHREAGAIGTSYVSVWPSQEDENIPSISYESGIYVVHEMTAGDRQTVAAALKMWVDTIDNQARCNVYTDEAVYRWFSPIKDLPSNLYLHPELYSDRNENMKWELLESFDHPYGIVPMVPFATNPNYLGYGVSDLSDIESTLKRLEYLTTNVLLAVELGALRQRWATGLEIPKDENGEPIETFQVALDRLWLSPDPETKFGSFEATDVNGYLKAISDGVGQLSAVSRIPMHYLVQSELANPPSAESFEASETGLIAKVMDRREPYGDSWETVARLALEIAGREVADPILEVVWKDPRSRHEKDVMATAVQMQSLAIPWVAIMEYIGYSPTEISRMQSQRSADLFERLLTESFAQPEQPALAPAPEAP